MKISGLARLLLLLCATPAAAQSGDANCYGPGWDKNAPIGLSRVVATGETRFLKNAYDDKACPAATTACARKAYLTQGDVVLASRVFGAFACAVFVSANGKETAGWIPSSALERRAPAATTRLEDWIGVWRSRRDGLRGELTIRRKGEGLALSGEALLAVSPENVRQAELFVDGLKVDGGTLRFTDDGKPFDRAMEADCAVRMSRVDDYLLVEDTGACGGMSVTFTGLYRRR